ncbi:isoleucyl-tRNA synthetase [Hymenobacter luteus]|uniref:Isoleucine--tRNA ligase n=2 Tax=Hymenobacter TaxID=89966 RepID=A0A7W9T457_9BACT|nr:MULTISPECIES: isoleucine--tRNA ligase [Hymenobacter]MBB4603336.1 isoleucyl-tRNA synthetase [Hymenobacter latericoloratus]MBB6061106.1 isoleucyl-tRNA synthetase [Hymenobacter luteus]
MNYPEYKQPLNYGQVGTDILAWWKQNGIFEKSVSTREGQPTFVFYEGPPSANGAPGIHHVMARTVKDIFCRYQTLLGKQVSRKGGWDTHGLPIELQVEKELGITKEDIGKKISIEEYNQRCRETVMRFKAQWDDLTEKMGYWVDLSDPYITFEPEYIESCWALLKKLYDKGLLYKGYTIQPYSPAAGTGLSSHELNQPGTYRDVKDTTIVAQFQVKRDEKSEKLFVGTDDAAETFILAWTTTPWTLPANTGLAVGKNIPYAVIRTFNPYTYEPIAIVLARALVDKYFINLPFSKQIEQYDSEPELNIELVKDWIFNGKSGITAEQAKSYIRPSESYKRQMPYEIVKEFTGADLVGIRYERLFGQDKGYPAFEGEENAFRVINGDFVTTEDGTGIVHISPTFGADDFRAAQLAGVPALLVADDEGKLGPVVDRTGRYVAQMGEFGGRWVKNYDGHDDSGADYKTLDESIAIRMKGDGTAFKVEKYEHTYPHCWRTDKPVLYYPLDSWFIKTTAVKDRLIELNKTINWQPESTGTGRFGNWLENLVDWNLSRSRYWGTPLPIWRTQDGSEEICIGSIAELSAEIDKAVAAEVMTHNPIATGEMTDLHRPYVDDVFLVSPSGQPMYRETDLIDVWFDSGAMPYAQWHYPLENQEIFRKNFPADFIAEGVDQTRGWFFTLHALAVMLEDSVAYKNVMANGLVLDKNGNKMSKRLGNAIDPFATINQFGPDATRWYMIANAQPWDNLKFDLNGITEVQRRFFGTLFNTYSFYALYANLDGFQAREFDRVPYEDLTELDRWILSKLQSLIVEVRGHYDSYDPTKAARAIQDFVTDQLSNWHVRLSRRRFWKGELTADKRAAYETLQECLVVVAQLMAPIAPFFAEWLYKNMTDGMRAEAVAKNTPLAPESVHLTLLVQAEENRIDKALEERMDLAQRISSLTHSLRKKSVLKVRQPLQRILVPVFNETTREQVGKVEDLICAEVNVKHVEFLDDTSGVLVKSVKPNFKRLGQQYGAKLKAVGARIQQMTPEEISTLEKTGQLAVEIDGEAYTLAPDDVEIRTQDLPGWLVATDGPLTVALDVTLTEELRQEGVARELVNRLQNLRKDSGLEVQDKVRVTLGLQPELQAAVQSFGDYIREEVQALALDFSPDLNGGSVLEFDEYTVPVQLEVATV